MPFPQVIAINVGQIEMQHFLKSDRNKVTPIWPVLVWSIGALISALQPACSCEKPGDDFKQSKRFSCEEQLRRPNDGDAACPVGEKFFDGRCVAERCDVDNSGCCPGTVCTSDGLCKVPSRTIEECETNADCTDAKVCQNRPRVSESKTCAYAPLDDSGLCPRGTNEFNDRCVKAAPCGGGCLEGSVCNIDNDACESIPLGVASCEMSCGDSAMLVYASPDTMIHDSCCATECVCETLPALPIGNWGSYADMVLTENGVFVASYDPLYGDAVFTKHGLLGAELDSIQYLDGIPPDAAVVADPDGLRAGIREAGPDVGSHISLAFAGNEARLAYFDEDQAALKFAAFDNGSGVFKTSLVDSGIHEGAQTADVGRYTDLYIDADQRPHILYFVYRRLQDETWHSSPMYARGKNTSPNGPDDWDFITIDPLFDCGGCAEGEVCVQNGNTQVCAPKADGCTECLCGEACVDLAGAGCLREMTPRLNAPCNGTCLEGEVCTSDTNGSDQCSTPLNTCVTTCAESEFCIDNGSGSGECRPELKPTELGGLKLGNGMFGQWFVKDSRLHALYHDGLRGSLRVARADANLSGSIQSFSTAGALCENAASVGQHLSAAVHDGTIYVAYQKNAKQLEILESVDLFATQQSPTSVDDGAREGGNIHLVGAYTDILVTQDGAVYVAYLDQSNNDLRLAYRKPGDTEFKTKTILEDGAHGSFAQLTERDGLLYLGAYQRDTSSGDDESRFVFQLVETSTLE